MSEQSIGNNSQDPGSAGVEGGYSIYTPASLPASVVTSFSADSMSISEVGTSNSNNMADTMNPRLQKPTYADIAMLFEMGTAKIICDMLTNWNKALQDEAERVKEERSSPAYQAWLDLHSTQYIAEQDLKSGKNLTIPNKSANEQQASITTGTLHEKERLLVLMSGMSHLLATTAETIQNSRASRGDDTIQGTKGVTEADGGGHRTPGTMAATLAIGAGFIANFSQAPNVSSTNQVDVKAIQDAWNQVSPSNDLMSQTGGWFSAMWGIGLIYQLSAQNITELGAGHEKGPHKDLEFAKGYAQNLLNSLEGNAFNISLLALLTPMLEKTPEAKADRNPEHLAAKGKLILLAMALALVYKLELKSKDPNAEIDELTFAAMLKGNVDFSKNDEFGTAEIKRQLVAYFNLALQGLPAEERVKVLEGILAYISKKPDVENLLDQQKAFSEVLVDGDSYNLEKPV